MSTHCWDGRLDRGPALKASEASTEREEDKNGFHEQGFVIEAHYL